MSGQRLLAFLALHERSLLRLHVACVLWPDVSEERSLSNLRGTLWRLPRRGVALVETNGRQIRLPANATVDVRELVSFARGVIRGVLQSDDEALLRPMLSGDLLPDWYDDWVEVERERLRELRLHALEALAARYLASGRYGEAADAALAAVQGDPLRETAHRAVIEVFLAEGNAGGAVRHYRLYRRALRNQLGLDPSQLIDDLIGPLLADASGRPH